MRFDIKEKGDCLYEIIYGGNREIIKLDKSQVLDGRIGPVIWKDSIKNMLSHGWNSCVLFVEKAPLETAIFWRGWVIGRANGSFILYERLFLLGGLTRFAAKIGILNEKWYERVVERVIRSDLRDIGSFSSYELAAADLWEYVGTSYPKPGRTAD